MQQLQLQSSVKPHRIKTMSVAAMRHFRLIVQKWNRANTRPFKWAFLDQSTHVKDYRLRTLN